MQADTSAEPADLGALVMALRLLVAAFEATVRSAPALALLSVLREILAIVAHYQADPERRRLDAFTTGDGCAHPSAGLTSLPIAPPRPAPEPSLSTARSSPSTPQPLPRTVTRVAACLHAALDAWGEADQLAAVLARTVRSLDAPNIDLDEYMSDLRDELQAVAGALCEASGFLSGLSAGRAPVAHAVRLRELLAANEPTWLRETRQRELITDAREALAQP